MAGARKPECVGQIDRSRGIKAGESEVETSTKPRLERLPRFGPGADLDFRGTGVSDRHWQPGSPRGMRRTAVKANDASPSRLRATSSRVGVDARGGSQQLQPVEGVQQELADSASEQACARSLNVKSPSNAARARNGSLKPWGDVITPISLCKSVRRLPYHSLWRRADFGNLDSISGHGGFVAVGSPTPASMIQSSTTSGFSSRSMRNRI
jgi:hypothetical protein